MKSPMKTIWKFALQSVLPVQMPQAAKILSVQMQNGEPQVWAEVNPNNDTVSRTFRVYGTGHTLPDNPGTYVGTFQQTTGLVWHVYDKGEQIT